MTSSYCLPFPSEPSRPQAAGSVRGGVRLILQLEGLALFVAAVVAFNALDGSPGLFAALFFAPDLAFLAYLVNPRLGATAYNALHTTVAPLLLALAAHFTRSPSFFPIAAVWMAHIGFDRSVGYGLKYASAFGDTHLGRKGGPRP